MLSINVNGVITPYCIDKFLWRRMEDANVYLNILKMRIQSVKLVNIIVKNAKFMIIIALNALILIALIELMIPNNFANANKSKYNYRVFNLNKFKI